MADASPTKPMITRKNAPSPSNLSINPLTGSSRVELSVSDCPVTSAEGGHASGNNASACYKRSDCARDPGCDHYKEKGLHDHRELGNLSIAIKIPRRISIGSGGQPGTTTSTGITLSTLPTTA